ncbi:mannitol dehydrogenase family protein [Ahrensia kielensis]|uniref:Mannitol dehydrogenase family protein n=1 Tax=Ahrensia kielensis TaxID=76980 RepID=A0ABU9T6B2_9HYPH
MQSTPILQFGTSRFLQAHIDLFVSQAMDRGQVVGPITIVQSSGDSARAKRLEGLVGAYPVRVEGLIEGRKVQETITVRSIVRALTTATDWPEIARIFVEEVSIVLSNTGDKGFAPQPCDMDAAFDQAMSYPAKLTQLLRLRFEANGKPIQIMPMELIVENGAVLKKRVLEIAQNDSADFKRYLDEDVVWVNSLVDRIVSEPLEPAGAVAEPYALWAIEDQPKLQLPCEHESIKTVASLDEIEALKLFVLNLGHSFFADRWLARKGSADVVMRQLMEDENELAALKKVYSEEVRPAFVVAGLKDEFDAYVRVTLDRFANPFLDHKIADIAQNHQQKVERRIKAMLDWAIAKGDQSDKPILQEIVDRNTETA